MSEQNQVLSSLTDNKTAKNEISIVQQEILNSEYPDSSDIEIIEENINTKLKNAIKKNGNKSKKNRTEKKKSKLKLKYHKLKKGNLSQPEKGTTQSTYNDNDKVEKILNDDPVIIEDSEITTINTCSGNVNLQASVNKELLVQNLTSKADTKKQKKEKRKKKMKHLSIAKDKNISETNNEVILVENESELIQKNENVKEVQILELDNTSGDETFMIQNIIAANNEIVLNKNYVENDLDILMNNFTPLNQLMESDENLEYSTQNLKNFSTDGNLFVINTLEENHDINSISAITTSNQESLILESDDWYYLNMVNNLEVPCENKSNSNTEKSIEQCKEIPYKLKSKKECYKTLKNTNKINEKTVEKKFDHNIKVMSELEKKVSIQNVETEYTSQINTTNENIQNESIVDDYVDDTNVEPTIGLGQISFLKEELLLKDNFVADEISNSSKNAKAIKQDNVSSKIPDATEKTTTNNHNDATQNNFNSSGLQSNPYIIKKELFTDNHANTTLDHEMNSDVNNGEESNLETLHNQNELDNCRYNQEANKKLLPTLTVLNRIACPAARTSKKKFKYIVACSICGKNYERIANLRKHEIICHARKEAEKLYSCVMCIFKTRSKKIFNKHLAKHIYDETSNTIKHRRTKMENTFKTKSKIKRNVKTTFKTKKNVVTTVKNSFQARNNKINKKHVFQPINRSRRNNKLVFHNRKQKQEKMAKEDLNNLMLNDSCETSHCNNDLNQTFQRKKKQKLNKDPTIYLKSHCSTCKEIKIALQYRDHCKTCRSTLLYSCSMCNKEFSTYASLRKHVVSNLRISRLKKCSKCGIGNHLSMCKLEKHEMICFIKSNMLDKLPYVRLVRYEEEKKKTSKPSLVLPTYCSKCDKTKIEDVQVTKCDKCESSLSYKCELCGELMSTYSDLRSHVLNSHIIGSFQDDTGSKSSENLIQTSQNSKTEILENAENMFSSHSAGENVMYNDSVINKTTIRAKAIIDKTFKSKVVSESLHKDNDFYHRIFIPYLIFRKRRRYRVENWIKRYCVNCDKTKKYAVGSNLWSEKICKNCKIELFHQCTKCNRKFKKQSAIKYHLKYWCKPISFKCTEDFCSLSSSYVPCLRNHAKRKHVSFDFQKYIKSSKYRESIKKIASLKNHKNALYIFKKYACKDCDYSTNYYHKLLFHQQIHAKLKIRGKDFRILKIYKCKLCPYKCSLKAKLEFHLQIHKLRDTKKNSSKLYLGIQ